MITGGGRGVEDEHGSAGGAGAAIFRASGVWGVDGVEEGVGWCEKERGVCSRFQEGDRAFLHPCRGEGGDRGDQGSAEAGGGGRGGVEDDTVSIREHVVVVDVVRAGIPGGEGEREERRQSVAAHIWEWVQVQQCSLEVCES